MMNFAIAVHSYDGAVVIELVGEFDLDAAPTFGTMIAGQLERGERRFIVDLDKLTYIDSRGIYALIEMLRAVRAADGDACLVMANPRIARVMTIAGIERALPFAADRAGALAGLRTAVPGAIA